MTKSSYPVVLTHLAAARCVVVGGGVVAERKAAGLLDAGAHPTVISPTLTPALTEWQQTSCITHVPRLFATGDLAGAALVIAATDDAAVNAAVAAEGHRIGALVNVAGDSAAGSFHTVGTVRRGDLLLTVSTGGMGVGRLAEIAARLAQAGRAAETPAAVVRWGSTAEQATVVATLATIADAVAQARLEPPALLVVGEVVSLQATLAWFEPAQAQGLTLPVAAD